MSGHTDPAAPLNRSELDRPRATRGVTMGRRAAVVTVLLPAVAAALVATAGPVGAIPTEGTPGPGQCVRVVDLDLLTGTLPSDPGSPLFVSHGRVAALVDAPRC